MAAFFWFRWCRAYDRLVLSLTQKTFRTSALALFGGLALLAAAGCSKPKDTGDAPANREEPPALAKAREEPAKATVPQNVAPPSVPASKDKARLAGSDDAAPEVDEDDEDEDEAVAHEDADTSRRTKKRRSKAKRPSARKRSSSAPASDDDRQEPADSAPAVLRLKRIQFSHSVEGREPVEPEETFSAAQTDKLYAFLELSNESKVASKVVVTFIPPMGAHSKVTLDVGDKSRWRTWASRRSPKAVGTWKVVVRDEAGRELGHRSFEVTE